MPRNSPHIKMIIFSAQHHVTGIKPNVEICHDPENNLDRILEQIVNRESDARSCRLIIFISDFQLCPLDSADATIEKIDRINTYVESKGHLVSFAFLAYIPAYSLDPKCKTKTTPNPDLTDYLTNINLKIKSLASGNPIGQAFGNKSVGYNRKKDNYKGTSWVGYNSSALEHLRFAACYNYTQHELEARTDRLYNFVEKFVDSLG